jgi:hypothetical protein
MIHVLSQPATDQQINEMLEVQGDFIKVAADIRRGMLAGGGEFHADCESALIEEGSRQEDIWGADWLPQPRAVRCSALINIRPRTNPTMEIRDPQIRQRVEQITREVLQRP